MPDLIVVVGIVFAAFYAGFGTAALLAASSRGDR
jgi:hypothetical protein